VADRIAIAVIWIIFSVNFFATLKVRREKHMYVALWFYIATIITVAVLHVGNNLVVPYGWFNSYPIYAGVQDALVQWWYGHNAVAFFLTTPFLGLMYYFLPKAANRPIFSYRLSIVHFWSLVFIYIWAGPHHLVYTALPEWAVTLGMLFSIMLWMPSWGGMINGLFTLRGAWHLLRESPVLKMFVLGITFYGMATFEGPDALSQERQCAESLHRLDHRSRSLGRTRLERVHDVRHDLLAAAAPLENGALEQEAGERALLGRDARHPALRAGDVQLGVLRRASCGALSTSPDA
jgi:cbb3-type cytochrome c oxidase subunit I